VAVHCAALAPGLLASELFGHVRGAFSGALRDRVGRFEAASGGTLFLDEIGEVPPEVQVSLLRVLEDRHVEAVGSNESRPVNTRIVAATNRDLALAVREGRFRTDLYYRLRVVTLYTVPLRSRTDDLQPLTEHLLARLNARGGRTIRGLTRTAWAAILRHPWPGNVRELANALEHAFILARRRRIDADDLPPEIGAATTPEGLTPGVRRPGRSPLAAVSDQALADQVARQAGNLSQVARDLGVHRSSVLRRVRRLPPPRP
jgi:transcriptional regulator with PAS, ATPase and Fis domain